jgi:hypothetical protein
MAHLITRISVSYDQAFPNGIERIEYKARNYYGKYGQFDEVGPVLLDGGSEPYAIEQLRDDYYQTFGRDIFDEEDFVPLDLSR